MKLGLLGAVLFITGRPRSGYRALVGVYEQGSNRRDWAGLAQFGFPWWTPPLTRPPHVSGEPHVLCAGRGSARINESFIYVVPGQALQRTTVTHVEPGCETAVGAVSPRTGLFRGARTCSESCRTRVPHRRMGWDSRDHTGVNTDPILRVASPSPGRGGKLPSAAWWSLSTGSE